jgi:hypothetical protein
VLNNTVCRVGTLRGRGVIYAVYVYIVGTEYFRFQMCSVLDGFMLICIW